MTYAPATMLETRSYLINQDKAPPLLEPSEVGIVADTSHVLEGTGYHLGKDQLKFDKNPYSARTARDKAGLADPEIANAACAIDIDDDWDYMRQFFPWCVEECRKSAPDTLDIRELIYSPDGVNVFKWDRENGVTSLPRPSTQISHRTHGHISKYRDSTRRSLKPLFERFYRVFVGGGDDPMASMFVKFGDGENVPGGLEEVRDFQSDLTTLGADFTPVGGIDGKYGKGTQSRFLAIVPAALAGDGTHYNAASRRYVKEKIDAIQTAKALDAYFAAHPPTGGGLPAQAVIEEHTLTVDVDITVPRQTVTLQPVPPAVNG